MTVWLVTKKKSLLINSYLNIVIMANCYRDYKRHSYYSKHIWGFVISYALIFDCPNVGDRLTIDEDAPSIMKQCYPQ